MKTLLIIIILIVATVFLYHWIAAIFIGIVATIMLGPVIGVVVGGFVLMALKELNEDKE